VVKVLCYKSEGRWFDSRWCHGICHLHNPSDRNMALGSTQPLTEMITRRISWGKSGRCVRLTTLPPSCALVMKSGNLKFLEPSEPLQVCKGTDLLYKRELRQQANQLLTLFIRTYWDTPPAYSNYPPPRTPVALWPNADHGLLILEVSRSHTTTHRIR